MPDRTISEIVLVLAPLGRDAAIAADLLTAAGFESASSRDVTDFTRTLELGAGAAIVTEEAVALTDLTALANWVQAQPSWSDLPIILLTSRGALERNLTALRVVELLGNVSFLERPFHPSTLISVVRGALRSRRRQYETRAYMEQVHEGAAQLAVSEERRRLAVEGAGIGTWDFFPETGALVFDPVCLALFGLPPDTIMNFTLYVSMIRPEDRPRMKATVASALASDGPDTYQTEFRTVPTKGRRERWVMAAGKVYRQPNGVLRMTGTAWDISERKLAELALRELNETLEQRVEEAIRERKEAEEQLRQSQKMEAVGRLTGGIAHDFNNLLSAVMGNLELLQSRVSDPKAERLVGNALKAVNRGAKLTSQLLAFSRLQALSLKPIAVNRVIEGLDELLRRSVGPTVDIKLELSPAVNAAMGDANQLELAILNLAINARDAIEDGGSIVIGTAMAPDEAGQGLDPGPYVVISVRDTGSGMPEEVRQRAFEPFFTTKGLGKGTGLGLSQVYGIARQSGGTVTIDSEVGSGTTISIFLPAANEAGMTADDDASPQFWPVGNGQAVLVVDDDPDVRGYVVECLATLGYRPAAAADGAEALAYLDTSETDAMIVDYAMPGMTGAELAAIATARRPGLPIIFATGYADTMALQEALKNAPVLRKPFRMGQLATVVADTFAGQARGERWSRRT